MKFSASLATIIIAFTATGAMAQSTNSTTTVVPNNNMGGTLATASISVDNPNHATGASNQLNAGVLGIALTSAATAAVYALL